MNSRLFLAAGVLLLPAAAGAQSLPDLFKGRWAVEGGDCQPGFTLQAVARRACCGRTRPATWTVSRSSPAVRPASRPRPSSPRTGQPAGKAWVYEVLGPGQIAMTEGSTGHSATLFRCPDVLPASATPQQIVQAIYARYAADDEPNLPLSSEANLRAFFVPGLADSVVAFMGRSGRVADDCRPEDPFVPFSTGDGPVRQLSVAAPEVAGPDHATVRASFHYGDTPVTVVVQFDHTAAGWRIADIVPASGRPFRAGMAACATPAK